jgi:oxazoline/thiazoline synthase
LSEREKIWLNDRLFCLLATLIDGDRNIEDIIDIIQQSILQDQEFVENSRIFFQKVLNMSIKAQYALLQMQQKGYLVEQNNSLPSQLEIYCHHLNIEPTVAYRLLQLTKVAVKTLGSVSADDFITMLESLEIQVAEEGDLLTKKPSAIVSSF